MDLVVHPADVNHGIIFRQASGAFADRIIPAHYLNVADTFRCTTLANPSGASVKTVEHILAALVSCGIGNALIDIDGPEVPAMDGSALPFARKILDTGIRWQPEAPLRVVRVRRPVVAVCNGQPSVQASLSPHDGLRMRIEIDYPEPIGHQVQEIVLRNGMGVSELSACRTFCLGSEIGMLQAAGLGLGGVVGQNVVVADDRTGSWRPGRRHEYECVRHKMLDAVGDLALVGMPVIGKFVGKRSGHTINIKLLNELFSDTANYEVVDADQAFLKDMLGVDVTASDLPLLR